MEVNVAGAGPDSSSVDSETLRIYEIGYHVLPSVKEEDVEKVVSSIRSSIEKQMGTFIAEGSPALVRLAYPITGVEAGKRIEFDRGYFGWLKFEAPIAAAQALAEELKQNKTILRHILFQTVREDTRAKLKAPTLREVRRTDVIKSSPKRDDEVSAPISEVDLDKALDVITAE